MIPIEHLMLITALLLGLSIVSSQISLRLSVPALLGSPLDKAPFYHSLQ